MRLLVLLFLLVTYSGCTAPRSVDLINSTAWRPVGDASWRYAGKQVIGWATDGQAGALMTTQPYGDFDFRVEFKPDSTVNSGVFVRCAERVFDPNTCYEFNIWDNNPNQTYRTGGVVLRAEPTARVETTGQWNTYRVEARGGRLRAWINDVPVANLADTNLASGYFGLQAAGEGEVRFRNARVREL